MMIPATESLRTPSTERTPLVGSDASPNDNGTSENRSEDGGDEGKVSIVRGVVVCAMVGVLMFIQSMNISMVTTTQSSIAADLDAFAETTWFTAAFLIAMSSLTPVSGRLSQIFSPRTLLFATSIVMSAGLLTTGAASSLPVFLLGRVLTGCGGAGVYSTSIILVLDLVSKKRRGLFLGMTAAGYTTGLSTGAVVAGAVTPQFGWRLIYYIQAPLALLAGPLAYLAIPSQRNKDPERERHSFRHKLGRIDYLGVVTLTTANVLFLYSLASTEIPVVPIILAIILFGVFLAVEASPLTAEPIIPISLVRSRGMLLTCIASVGLMMGRWSILFYTPVYAIAVRGWSPASAGLILVPTNAGFGLGGLLVGWVHIRKASSYYTSCLLIFILFSISVLFLSTISTPSSNVIVYIVAIFFNGFCTGALLNYTLSHVLHLTFTQVHFIVTSLIAMFRGFAGSFGSAIGGGIFARVLKRRLEAGFAGHSHDSDSERIESLIRRLLGSPALVARLDGFEKKVAVDAYESATKTLFLTAFALAVVTTVVQAGTGWTAPTTPKEVDGGKDSEESLVGEERGHGVHEDVEREN